MKVELYQESSGKKINVTIEAKDEDDIDDQIAQLIRDEELVRNEEIQIYDVTKDEQEPRWLGCISFFSK